MKLNSHQLRVAYPKRAKKLQTTVQRNPIVLILDNILDTYNIGSFFRLADAIAAEKIFLCGSAVTPPNIKIHRASIGTWKFVPWEQVNGVGECLKKLKGQGYQIVSCEQLPTSTHYLKAKYQFPLALVIGSETVGVSREALNLSDLVVEIPLFGVNKSLNVLVAASVVSYNLLSKPKQSKP